MSQIILFEDIFDVGQINPDGKKFERVNRLHCRGTTYDIQLTVDVNAELFPCKAGERVKIALASTLSKQGIPDDGTYNPSMGPSLADDYDYVMHGRLFKIEHVSAQNIEVNASFGGLLFKLVGDQVQLQALSQDMQFFLLARKGQ